MIPGGPQNLTPEEIHIVAKAIKESAELSGWVSLPADPTRFNALSTTQLRFRQPDNKNNATVVVTIGHHGTKINVQMSNDFDIADPHSLEKMRGFLKLKKKIRRK
jgi:hypothetical protein